MIDLLLRPEQRLLARFKEELYVRVAVPFALGFGTNDSEIMIDPDNIVYHIQVRALAVDVFMLMRDYEP